MCYLIRPLHPITKLVMLILMCNPIAYDQTLIPTPNLGLLYKIGPHFRHDQTLKVPFMFPPLDNENQLMAHH